MPQLKQPMALEEICVRLHINKYCGKCEKWLQDLLEAKKRDKYTYKVVFDNVMKECREMAEEISKLPPGILKLLSPRLPKKFAKLINTFDRNSRRFPRHFRSIRRHVSLCKALFRSVLTRFVYKFDTGLESNTFVSFIMAKNLHHVPGLLELYLYPCHHKQSGLLASKMRHVKNLRIFKCHYHCTDKIITQLQRHCPHLTELDVTNSLGVTNASVQPLKETRKLKYLNLYGTQIGDEQYAMILSELPNIANITSRENEASILRHIAVGSLDTITHVSGYIQDIDTLTHKCPNITNIDMTDMYPRTRDLLGLTAFNVLRALEIHHLDYGSSDFNAVLQVVGHRLTDLKLSHAKCVDLQDITTLCPTLVNLFLIDCTFLHLDSNTPLDPRLPHFKNLIHLELRYPFPRSYVSRYVQCYVSLKTIHFMYTSTFTVEFVREMLSLDTYKQLETLRVEEHWREDIDVNALQLLIWHCPILKRIEIVGRKPPDRDVFGELKRQILLQNFGLKFKENE
jgi:hypothetical protein